MAAAAHRRRAAAGQLRQQRQDPATQPLVAFGQVTPPVSAARRPGWPEASRGGSPDPRAAPPPGSPRAGRTRARPGHPPAAAWVERVRLRCGDRSGRPPAAGAARTGRSGSGSGAPGTSPADTPSGSTPQAGPGPPRHEPPPGHCAAGPSRSGAWRHLLATSLPSFHADRPTQQGRRRPAGGSSRRSCTGRSPRPALRSAPRLKGGADRRATLVPKGPCRSGSPTGQRGRSEWPS